MRGWRDAAIWMGCAFAILYRHWLTTNSEKARYSASIPSKTPYFAARGARRVACVIGCEIAKGAMWILGLRQTDIVILIWN